MQNHVFPRTPYLRPEQSDMSIAQTSTQSEWSNLAKVVFNRTYARRDSGSLEKFPDAVERVLAGNVRSHNVSAHEIERLRYFLLNRKAGPAGRGWWFSGTEAHSRIGGVALSNCWGLTADSWENFVIAQDLLMLGGGVGLSVEHRFISKIPRIKRSVEIRHKASKDADLIVPDSREGWCELLRRTLESFFVTGRSFTYSTVCIRGAGERILGFGGTSSGPIPLINMVEKICAILLNREGRALRPIDAADILCAIGEMVVSGNVRRSAVIIMGDPWDREYLKAKRWDLGPIPTQRSCANWSVIAEDVEELHSLFWKTFEAGEAFGLVNRTAIQRFGRIGEMKKDTATVVNPCAEATLESGENCNLQEIALPNIADEDEFIEAARLMHRWGKRVSLEPLHHKLSADVVARNRRVGTGITGCLASPLFNPRTLDAAYAAIQVENVQYSKDLGINESIRTTVVKPSGTMSKMMDMHGYEGIHPAYSRYIIQRVRFAANDPLIPLLLYAGHYMEPVSKFDGSLDHGTIVVDFYEEAGSGPVADEDWDTWKQLDAVKTAQRHWADQAVSVSVYYKREDIGKIKEWLTANLAETKTISFLCHSEHGFKQAPKEAISKKEFDRLSKKIQPVDISKLSSEEFSMDGTECAGGACPVK